MPETTRDDILARAQVPTVNGRPIRKDEIELPARGLYIESWLPERRSRRKPLLFVHGELGGSWSWERFLGYFASRGWEGHALNLRNHYLMGQKPRESGRARRTILRGVRVDPAKVASVPRLVVAGGLDRTVPLEMTERLATWLGAEYQLFGAHSHYGLILGEESYQQVADTIRGFLEANRL